VSLSARIQFADAAQRFDAHVAVADDVGNLISISAVGLSNQWERTLRASSHGLFAVCGVPEGVWELRIGTQQELERGSARWRRRMVFAQGKTEPLEIKL